MGAQDEKQFTEPGFTDRGKAELVSRARTVTGDAAWVFVHHKDLDVAAALVENEGLSLTQQVKFLERRDLNARIFSRVRSLDHWWKSQAVRVALAKNPKTPLAIAHPVIRSLGAFQLCDVANSPYVIRDVQVIVDRVLTDRLKVMPIGQRVTLARRATPQILESMLKGNPHRFVVEAALTNPKLNEKVLEVTLAQSDWEVRCLELVVRHPEWGVRYGVRRALFRNRNLDIGLRREIAQEITRQDLMEIVQIHHRDHTLIRIVTIEMERRGYPDVYVRGLQRRRPPETAPAERPDGPRGMSVDELRAMMEADAAEAGADGDETGPDPEDTEPPADGDPPDPE